jgi:hypothetical protein
VWDRQREDEGRRREGEGRRREGEGRRRRAKVEGRSKGQKGGAKGKRIKGIHEERCCGILFDVPRYVSAIIPKKCAFSLQF